MSNEIRRLTEALDDALTSFKAVAVHSVQTEMREDAKQQVLKIEALLKELS
ncbi:MAG TPA: hypothetical protein VJ521_16860 [Acidobacteriota bacterium]|nr:hypothetical protein [Acidobacteriota bacterium]